MVTIDSFMQGPQTCPYLGDRESTLEYVVVARLSPAEYEGYMNEGWRKFGPMLFRPVCDRCNLCRPIRIPIEGFRPNRSQRRNLKRNTDLEVHAESPQVSAEHIDLYNRYHAGQNTVKEWPEQSIEPQEYSLTFLNNPVPSLEITARKEGRLLGSLIADVTTNALSAVYHFYEPDERDRGLGKFLILRTIEAAMKLGLPYVYLGYYVSGSKSMAYKTTYRPHEILTEQGAWEAR